MHQPFFLLLLLLLLLPFYSSAFLPPPPPPLLPSHPITTKLSASTSTQTSTHTHTLPGLISTAWLHHHIDDEDLSILDIRGEVAKAPVSREGKQATEYLALHSDYVDGHIPNSVFVDWTQDIAQTETHTQVPVQLLPLDELKTAMEEKGVGLRKRVVIYDNGNLLFATRLWWALQLAGHEAVGVLDGGYAKWLAEDRPVSVDCPCPLKINEPWEDDNGRKATSLFVTEEDAHTHTHTPFLSARVEADFVLSSCVHAPTPAEVQIIDARSQEQYLGKVSRSLRGGHIPRALSVPYKELLAAPEQDAGTGLWYRVMKSREGLEATLRAAGVRVCGSVNDDGSEGKDEMEGEMPKLTCVYCNGGVASTVVIFVLNQLYGMQTVNYDGSWNEWGKREDLPVEM